MSNYQIIAYPLLPIAAMELLLGFLLLTGNRRSSRLHGSVAALAFFSAAFALNTAVMYLTASKGLDFNFFARLNWIGWFAIPSGLQFLLYFRSEESGTARRTGYILYTYWTVVLALCLFTDLIVTSRYSLIPYQNYPGPLEIPARILAALMTVWLIIEIVRIRRGLAGIRKFQVSHFLYGMLIYSLAGVVIAGVLPAVKGVVLEPGLASYFSLPWIALTFYAIVRYSLFEMRIIFSRMLAIIILLLACTVCQAAVLAAFAPALGEGLSIFFSLSLLGFFLFGTPVSRILQSFVDRIVVGSRYQYETLTREAMVTFNTKQEMPDLIEYLIQTVSKGLGTSDAGVFLYRVEDGYVLREGSGRFLTLKNQASLPDLAVKKLRENKQSLVLAAIVEAGDDEEVFQVTTYLRGTGTEALVPLLLQGRLLGALAVGRKPDGKMFGEIDLGFLETLAAHASSALENARLSEITRTIRSSLQESEERFMTLAKDMPAAVFIYRAGSILYANGAAEEMTGYPRSRLTAMSIVDLFHPDSVPLQGPAHHWPGKEIRVLHADGTQRWAVMTSAVIEYGEQAAVIGILFDITEHKRNEGKLRYERMREAVARMASYLSGDLERLGNDLRQIATLQGYNDEDQRHPEAATAGRIDSVVEQADFLVRTMKELSIRKEPKRSPQDLSDLVVKRKQILAAMLTGKCELVMLPSPETLTVMADPLRIESALMNLVLNARERVERGGVITVSTGHSIIDANFIRRTGFGRIGVYATVSVKDTGRDLTVPEQERGFEPFFAMQEGWQGSGLGLSLVYDIVKEHEGYITVSSGPEGTSYTAYLPLEQARSRPHL
jgi:PAS domain S-box-containing protein